MFLITPIYALMGGWNAVNEPNSNSNVIQVAQWAGNQLFPGKKITANINSAEQQVVAGINYK